MEELIPAVLPSVVEGTNLQVYKTNYRLRLNGYDKTE